MSTNETRRSSGSCRAAIADEMKRTLIEPILAAPDDERKGYAAVLGMITLALVVLYAGSYFVGKFRGWW